MFLLIHRQVVPDPPIGEEELGQFSGATPYNRSVSKHGRCSDRLHSCRITTLLPVTSQPLGGAAQ